MFIIKAKKSVEKFFRELPDKDKKRVERALMILKENPLAYKRLDIAKVEGYKNIYRLRVGKIRIIYEVFWNERIILLHRAHFRGKIYKKKL